MPQKAPQPPATAQAGTPGAAGMPALSRDEYKYLSEMIMRQSGLSLGESKEYLLTSRLEPLAKSLGMRSLSEMVAQMRSGKKVGQDRIVAEALATHETLFFRDPDTFVYLRQLVAEKLAPSRQAGEKLRIWSAACSSGQEAYSLMIMADELAAALQIRVPVEIIATDFSKPVVEKAREGIYTSFEVGRGLTPAQRDQYFTAVDKDRWQVRGEYRSKVRFEDRNLLDGFASLGTFDLVLCRNVLIYFDVPTKADILRRMSKSLAKHGVLVLGASESILNVVDCYDTLAPNRISFLKRK